MHRGVTLSIFFFFILIIIPARVNGRDTKEQEKLPPVIEEIVVKGEVVAETATVTMITSAEIREKGAKTVAEALEHIPGTHVRVGGKGEAYIRLRGFRQREMALLIDGIPVSSPYNGQLDLSSLPVDSIERIDVVRGGGSVMYGSNAMGGVVNIITRKSTGTRRISLAGQYGSGENLSLGASVAGGLGRIRYLISGAYLNQEYYPLSGKYEPQANQAADQRDNSDRRMWNGKVNLGWDINESSRLALNFSHLDQVRGLPHHESDKKAKFYRFDDWQQGIFDIVYDVSLGQGLLKVKAFYEYLNNALDRYDDITYATRTGKNSTTETMNSHAIGADLFYRRRLGRSILFKSALRLRRDTNEIQEDVGQDWRENKVNVFSWPLEMEWTNGRWLDVTVGASLDMMFFEKGEGLENTTTPAFNPQLAMVFHLNPKVKLKLSASRKTRFPTMRELFSLESGNPELDPMKATILEAGVLYSPVDGLSLSLNGFYNDIDGLISRHNNTTAYENVDKAEFKGLEMGVELLTRQRISLSVFYTYLDARDKSSTAVGSIEYRPKHKIDSTFTIRLPYQFFFSLFSSYVSSQTYYSGDEKMSLDPYFLMDIKLKKQLGKNLQLFLSARNLFDVDYYESEGHPREGRMIFGGFQIEIK